MPEFVLEIINTPPLLLEIMPGVGPRGSAGGGGGGAGEDGLSAYEVWLNAGHEGTEAEFLEWLKGAPGDPGGDGAPGATGASAYQVWLAAGHAGTEGEFLEWLKGAPGDPGGDGAPGATGASAYQVWLAAGHVGTEGEFLEWLKGAPGDPGAPGPAGAGLPAGGTVGQIPTKLSAVEGDTGWKNAPKGVHYPLAFPSLSIVGAAVDQSVNASGVTTVTLTANSIDWSPFLPVNDLKIAEIGVYVSTAVAGNIELGIYEDNGYGAFADGAPLVKSTILSSATTGLKSFVIPGDFTFQGGKAYWLVVGVTAACAMYALPVAAMMPLYIYTTTGSRANIRRTTATGALPALAGTVSAPFATASTPQFRMKLAP